MNNRKKYIEKNGKKNINLSMVNFYLYAATIIRIL